jgi:hypothetical protein
MKIRIIERNDGKFEYEYGYTFEYSSSVIWNKLNYLFFNSEEEARNHVLKVIEFMKAHETKRVVAEIDI